MLVNGDDHLFQWQAEFLGRAVHDADIRLVRDQPVDLVRSHVGVRQCFVRNLFQHGDGQLEHGRAIHVQEGATGQRAASQTARYAQDVRMAAVRVQLGGQDAWLGGGRHDDGASAVAEQHAGAAVVEIEDARKHFGADHQHVFMHARLDEAVGRGHRIHEAAADGLHVDGGAVVRDAQLALHDAGSAGETAEEIGGRAGDDDQVQVVAAQARHLQRLLGRFHTQVRGVLHWRRVMARRDAAARDDPFIRRLDALGGELLGQILVGDALLRQVAAGADNFAVSFAKNSHASTRPLNGRAC